MGLSKESIINSLRESYGESVTSAEIKVPFCQMNDFNYQTITNKLTDFKVSRGKWNLEVTKETVKELETTYTSPARILCLQFNKTLSHVKMIPSSSLAISLILKKLLSPVFSIHRSLLVSLETAKRSQLSKRVQRWVANSSASTSR